MNKEVILGAYATEKLRAQTSSQAGGSLGEKNALGDVNRGTTGGLKPAPVCENQRGQSGAIDDNRMRDLNPEVFDYSQFYCFRLAKKAVTAFADLSKPSPYERNCAIGRGDIVPSEPIELQFMQRGAENRRLDRIPATDLALYVFSDRFFEMLKRIGATGWSDYPVILRSKQGVECTGYRGLAVHGKTGKIVDSLSAKAVDLPKFPGCPACPALVGYLFEPHSWDGHDICLFENTLRLMITRRVARAIREEKFRGIEMERIDLTTRRDDEVWALLTERGYFDACEASRDHRVLRDFM